MNKVLPAWIALQCITISLFAAEEDMPSPEQGLTQTLIMIGVALAFFYLILWRPEQKRRKALDDQRASMKQGDRVVAMGIVGSVVRVEEQTVIVKMYDGSKLEFLKGAITDVSHEKEASSEN